MARRIFDVALAAATAVVTSAAPTAELIWTQSTAAATYTTASIVHHNTTQGATPSFVAATWLNNPIEVEAYNTSDNGAAPLWAFQGCGHTDSAFWATTARHSQRQGGVGARADTLAVETQALPPATLVVSAFDSTSPSGGSPLWNYSFETGQVASIDMSDDGSTAAIALWQWNAAGVISSWLFVFDAQTGAVRFSVQEPLARGGPCTLSGSGAYIAWTQGDSVAVIDGASGSQRGSLVSVGWNTEAQISDSGDTLVVLGKEDGGIYLWNATLGDYSLALTIVPPDDAAWYSDSSSLASNSAAYGDVAAFGFLGSGALQARVLIYAAATGALLTDYTTPLNAKLQTNTYLRSDGDYVGVALWGDQDDVPTVALLKAGVAAPLFTYTTPGSMVAVDVVQGSPGEVYLAAAGKHTPANIVGNGGDAYTWRITGA